MAPLPAVARVKAAVARVKMPNEKKVALLNVIKDKKDVLFGKFSSELDNIQKHDAWHEVLVKAKSLELVTDNRDYVYVRDKLYGLWKTRALEKKDNKEKTGQGGGKEKVLTDVDLLILEIIGKETPVIDGLPVGESQDPVPATSDQESSNGSMKTPSPASTSAAQPIGVGALVPWSVPLAAKPAAETPKGRPTTNQESQHSRVFKRNHRVRMDNEKRRKLQCEMMEVKMYKELLECYKLEQELNLPWSKITEPLNK